MHVAVDMMGETHYPACYYFTNEDFDKKVKSQQSASHSCSQSGSQLVTSKCIRDNQPFEM